MIRVHQNHRLGFASYGRKTQAVILMDTDHVILSAIPTETISARWTGSQEQEAET